MDSLDVTDLILAAIASAPSTGIFIIFVPGDEEDEGLIDKDDPFALANPFGSSIGGGSIQDVILMDNPAQS